MFAVGTRVRVISQDEETENVPVGATGRILDLDGSPFVEFDAPLVSGHDACGLGKDGHCWSMAQSQLEAIA